MTSAGFIGLLIALISLCGTNAYAHNVIGGVYAIGSTIEGEIGFSNGDMAPEGTLVQVLDEAGGELTQVKTDAEGYFSYEAKQKRDYHFRADLGSGHLVDMTLPASELPRSLEALSKTTHALVVDEISTTTGMPFHDAAALETMITASVERAVAKQVTPLRKELAAYKEKAGLQDIIGGIGYIFGLCGFGIWWRERLKGKADASKS